MKLEQDHQGYPWVPRAPAFLAEQEGSLLGHSLGSLSNA